MLTIEEAFKQVLEIENTTEILDFAVPDIDVLLWPYVRFEILQKCVQTLVSNECEDPSDVALENTSSRLRLFAKTAWHCFKPWPQRDIFLLNAAGSQYHKIYNEKLYNVYQEPYAEIFPENTLFLDASPGPKFIRSTQFQLRRTAPISLLAGKMTRYMSNTLHETNVKLFLKFVDYRAKSVLSIEFPKDFYSKLYEKLLYMSKYFIAERKILNLFLPKKSPKLCIINCAHYGGDGNMIKLLKERGVIIAENQHGVISNEQPAYNWAEVLVNNEKIKKQSPDILLTYGDYWHQSFHAPGRCHTIGNAWFDICQNSIDTSSAEDAILLALNDNYDAFAAMIPDLQRAFPQRKIIVRPHPNQREYFKAHATAKLANVSIDMSPNIYDTFKKSSVVLGTYSMSLFEAAALGKRTFIYENVYSNDFSKDYFEHFSSADELIVKLNLPWVMPIDAKDVFFNRNWQENYSKFVSSCGV